GDRRPLGTSYRLMGAAGAVASSRRSSTSLAAARSPCAAFRRTRRQAPAPRNERPRLLQPTLKIGGAAPHRGRIVVVAAKTDIADEAGERGQPATIVIVAVAEAVLGSNRLRQIEQMPRCRANIAS